MGEWNLKLRRKSNGGGRDDCTRLLADTRGKNLEAVMDVSGSELVVTNGKGGPDAEFVINLNPTYVTGTFERNLVSI